jgi:hypothetical protein
MLDLILLFVSLALGLVLVAASYAVLHACRAVELSARAVAGLLLGIAGCWYVVKALIGPPPTGAELLLLGGVAIWIFDATRRKRSADAWPPAVDRASWLPHPPQRRDPS